jgi:hypothetical protein
MKQKVLLHFAVYIENHKLLFVPIITQLHPITVQAELRVRELPQNKLAISYVHHFSLNTHVNSIPLIRTLKLGYVF